VLRTTVVLRAPHVGRRPTTLIEPEATCIRRRVVGVNVPRMVSTEVLAPVEAVVFDLDDTLFDHTGSTRRGLCAWLFTLDVVPSALLAGEWFAAEERHFEAWRAGVISFDERRRRRLQDVLSLIGRPVGTDAALDSVFAGYLHC
jgi:putative hydrolase of the HAD superfamily